MLSDYNPVKLVVQFERFIAFVTLKNSFEADLFMKKFEEYIMSNMPKFSFEYPPKLGTDYPNNMYNIPLKTNMNTFIPNNSMNTMGITPQFMIPNPNIRYTNPNTGFIGKFNII